MNQPLVSVVIPTYSRPDRLSRAIDSVLNQTYENIEVIVVDDNNSDSDFRKETELEMQKYNNNKKVLYLKHSKNKNGSAARNTGIGASKGKYIAFLDDDDEYLPTKIEKQVNKMESLDSTWGACYTGYKKINTNSTVQYSREKREGRLFTEALMRSIYLGSGSNLLVRKSVVEEINGFDESFQRNQDIEFLVRILEKYKLAYVDSCELVVHYEIRETKRTLEELKKIDEHFLEKFKEKIDALDDKDKRKISIMIALDSFRSAIVRKEFLIGFKTLFKNKVGFITLCRYINYLVKRYVTKTSFGFEIK